MGTTATELEEIARRTAPAPPDRWAREAEALLRLCGVDQIIRDATVGPLTWGAVERPAQAPRAPRRG